jgi:hypothetical protein
MRRWSSERVKIPITVTSEEFHLGLQILDGEAARIKFHRNRVVTS